jgi:anaerobic magnesium-protoporphyrin IX monomethyl ester cyclase
MNNLQKEIVLVNPKDGEMPYGFYATYENLGIAYLTNSLRSNDISVAIVDAYARNLDYKEAAEEIISYRPKMVGFAATYLSIPEAKRIAEIIKDKLPDIHITIGGEHATYAAEEIFGEAKVFDSVIFGEGEATIVDLASAVLNNSSLESVLGIGYRANDNFQRNAFRPPIEDLDSISFPARDTLKHCIENNKSGLIGILGSRGCNYNCSFCNANEFFNIGNKPSCRRRSPKNIVDELEYIYKSFYSNGLYKLIYFYDATFIYPNSTWRQWAKEICEEIIKREIHVSFEINARADSFTEYDDELLYLLKRAGLKSVFIGLESGSEDVLEKYNKKTSVEQNVRIMEILKYHGIQSTTNGFIMFNPFISTQGLIESADFLVGVGQCTFWNLSQKVQLFPGIRMIRDLQNSGLLLNSYGNTEVYAYKFEYPKVEKLAEVLNFSYEEVTTRENHIVRYTEIMVTQVMDMVLQLDNIDKNQHEQILKLNNCINDARTDIFKTNRDFFVNTVNLMEQDWKDDEFKRMKGLYTNNLEIKLKILSSNFEDFLTYIDTLTN